MPEPAPIGGTAALAKLQAILNARGIVPAPKPFSDEPSPDEPGHPEYHRRQRVSFATKRWTTATPRRYQHAVATHPAVIAWADAVVADPDHAPSLLLTGTTGTGKTHQAYGALRRIAEAGPDRYELIATTAADMYGDLRPGGPIGQAEHRLKQLCEIPLLLIDDLGSAKASEWTEEITYRLINERYNAMLPTIFTSNLPPRVDDGRDLVTALGDRIVSRLAEMTTVVPMTGTDRRRKGAA